MVMFSSSLRNQVPGGGALAGLPRGDYRKYGRCERSSGRCSAITPTSGVSMNTDPVGVVLSDGERAEQAAVCSGGQRHRPDGDVRAARRVGLAME